MVEQDRPEHPYIKFEKTPLWTAVSEAVTDLEENQDLKLTELPEYIIGYICKQLKNKKIVTSESLVRDESQ